MLGLQAKPGGSLKDTSAHIRDRGAFVVNLVDEVIGEQMNQCAVDFPADVSEIDVAKFSLLPSEKVKIPRIAEAPAALECRHYTTLEVSPMRRLAIGEVLHVHVRKGLWDNEKMRVDMTQYRPLARACSGISTPRSASRSPTCGRATRSGWRGRRSRRAARSLYPLPCGEGRRERSECRVGVGVCRDHEASMNDPHP